jgi:hypothetical protein
LYHLQGEQNDILKKKTVGEHNGIFKKSEAIVFEWRFVLPADGTFVPKYVGDATLMLLFTGAVHLVGVKKGVLCSSQVFGEGSVVICFVTCSFWDRLCDFLCGLHSGCKDGGT